MMGAYLLGGCDAGGLEEGGVPCAGGCGVLGDVDRILGPVVCFVGVL